MSTAMKTPMLVGKSPHSWQAGPLDTQERLRRIEVMGQWINGYIQFMCQAGNPNGVSAAVIDKAVAVFYDEMVILERRLARIPRSILPGMTPEILCHCYRTLFRFATR